MKQYVHPNKRFIASWHYDINFWDVYYAVNTKFGDEVSVSSLICNESDLPFLWFIEKEEEPDTKWIGDVYKDLENDENSKWLCPWEQYYFLEIETLKKAILSHLPSRT